MKASADLPLNASDLLVEALIAWDIEVVFGLPGDGINGIMEALRQRQDRIRFIQVRHEESAAFMATGYAKWTGRLGCCLATSGPGGIHLLNGLYDAKADGVPVLALTGLPYHDLIGTHTQQDVDLDRLFADVALYSGRVMSAAHVENTVALACRTALAGRGVAHLTLPVDVQEESLIEAEASPRNVDHHVSHVPAAGVLHAPDDALDRAAAVLNAGKRVAILAGQGALGAADQLAAVADRLAAPVVKALLGKAVLPDRHPLTTGGVGLLGTRPSHEALEACDTLLIVGSGFPYIEYYPKPGQARGVQIDRNPARIGLRFPVEVGIAADAGPALAALIPRLQPKSDRSFLERAQAGMRDWRRLLDEAAAATDMPMRPERLARAVGDRLADDALLAVDSGHNTGLAARCIEMKEGQKFAVSGSLASMACGLNYAIAAAIACPGRQVVAFVGDGGLSMLLGELATVVRYGLPIKIVVLKNNTLGQIKWEQMMFLGNPEYECDLTPIDFKAVAEAVGIAGFRIERPEDCGPVLDRAFAVAGPALIEAPVDPNEPLLPPKRVARYAENLRKALAKGTPGRAEIEQALARNPAARMLEG